MLVESLPYWIAQPIEPIETRLVDGLKCHVHDLLLLGDFDFVCFLTDGFLEVFILIQSCVKP